MDTKKVNNKTWNGDDSAFLRCISSSNKSFYDVPIMYGTDSSMYGKMCECASLFVSSITGSHGYAPFDYWMRFNVINGEIVKHPEVEWCISGIRGVKDIYFKGDVYNLSLHGVYRVCVYKQRSDILDVSKMNVISDRDSFISDYNSAVDKSDSLRVSDDYWKLFSE